ncbi:hypothetical protein [Actinomadura hibisca]|uniref:hypothetical protein n=1 Tax=Actinomadura hibisca TaxID=68565 RepID=UPI000A9BA0FA|nr:hypothetical protein [Actinomadura hibisca]
MEEALTAQKAILHAALEVTKAAYEEALRQHGMLPSTIALITTYAERNLAALDEDDFS